MQAGRTLPAGQAAPQKGKPAQQQCEAVQQQQRQRQRTQACGRAHREPLLEGAAVLRAGHQRPHIQRDQRAPRQARRRARRGDELGDAFGHRRLPHAGIADEDGVVLGAAQQHLGVGVRGQGVAA